MLGRLNHIAIVVPDLEAGVELYRNQFGARVSEKVALPDHGVTAVFVELPNTKIELLHPLGADSPISRFLEKNPNGGMHHICFEVEDIEAAAKTLVMQGMRILGNGRPKMGAQNRPVLFLHPKDCMGVLIELEQTDPRGID